MIAAHPISVTDLWWYHICRLEEKQQRPTYPIFQRPVTPIQQFFFSFPKPNHGIGIRIGGGRLGTNTEQDKSNIHALRACSLAFSSSSAFFFSWLSTFAIEDENAFTADWTVLALQNKMKSKRKNIAVTCMIESNLRCTYSCVSNSQWHTINFYRIFSFDRANCRKEIKWTTTSDVSGMAAESHRYSTPGVGQDCKRREEDLIVANVRIWHDTLINWFLCASKYVSRNMIPLCFGMQENTLMRIKLIYKHIITDKIFLPCETLYI